MGADPTKTNTHCLSFPRCSHAMPAMHDIRHSFVRGAFGEDPKWRQFTGRKPLAKPGAKEEEED